MLLRDRQPYSWRDDPQVPAFDDDRILLVMDGDCALCSAGARRIARADREDRVRIATAGSPLGQALLRHFGLSPDDPDSWLMISDGRASAGLDAMIALLPCLSRRYLPLRVLMGLPKGARDWLYRRIARNRYRLFGHADMCAMPDPALRQRLLS